MATSTFSAVAAEGSSPLPELNPGSSDAPPEASSVYIPPQFLPPFG